jgi:hypothetical protein
MNRFFVVSFFFMMINIFLRPVPNILHVGQQKYCLKDLKKHRREICQALILLSFHSRLVA